MKLALSFVCLVICLVVCDAAAFPGYRVAAEYSPGDEDPSAYVEPPRRYRGRGPARRLSEYFLI